MALKNQKRRAQPITSDATGRVEGIEPFRAAELPKLEAAMTELQTAVTAYEGARKAYEDAFAVERAMRDEHRLAVDGLIGAVRAAYPGDKATQDTIFPDSAVTRAKSSDD